MALKINLMNRKKNLFSGHAVPTKKLKCWDFSGYVVCPEMRKGLINEGLHSKERFSIIVVILQFVRVLILFKKKHIYLVSAMTSTQRQLQTHYN